MNGRPFGEVLVFFSLPSEREGVHFFFFFFPVNSSKSAVSAKAFGVPFFFFPHQLRLSLFPFRRW